MAITVNESGTLKTLTMEQYQFVVFISLNASNSPGDASQGTTTILDIKEWLSVIEGDDPYYKYAVLSLGAHYNTGMPISPTRDEEDPTYTIKLTTSSTNYGLHIRVLAIY